MERQKDREEREGVRGGTHREKIHKGKLKKGRVEIIKKRERTIYPISK